MPNSGLSNEWLFGLLFIAVAIGWLVGRFSRPKAGDTPEGKLAQELPKSYYFRGLNYLINEEPDGAIDAFVGALEVNSETLETHIALGNLLRRRGEVDRAIRVHQNLLARPNIESSQVQLAHLELARDFIAAGLLDRAERILLELIDEESEHKVTCLKHLVEIYRDERDWKKAINAAASLPSNKLLPIAKHKGDFDVSLSHFCCELAEEAFAIDDYKEAKKQLKQALQYDKACVRASLLMAEIDYKQGEYSSAIKTLSRIPEQNPDYIPESTELVVKCYSELGDTQALKSYLETCLEAHQDISLILPITDKLQQEEGEESAANFLAEQLKRSPSIQGLGHFLELQSNRVEGEVRDTVLLLKELVDKLIRKQPKYRCRHCGFQGGKLHWLCPSCKEWGEIRGIESE